MPFLYIYLGGRETRCGTRVEVRGQLTGVSSLLLLCRFWERTWVFDNKLPYPLICHVGLLQGSVLRRGAFYM